MRTKSFVCLITLSAIFLTSCSQDKKDYTRGTGIYPGNPAEDFSPVLEPDNTYRNLAKLRPSYHSSSYDYSLTAQLVTDGIITSEVPSTIAMSTNQGAIPRVEREYLLDQNRFTQINLDGNKEIWIQLDLMQVKDIPQVTKINLTGELSFDKAVPGTWQITCSGSNDGVKWDVLTNLQGNGLPGQERINPFGNRRSNNQPQRRNFGTYLPPVLNDTTVAPPSYMLSNYGQPRNSRIINQTCDFHNPVAYTHYLVKITSPTAQGWRFNDLNFYHNSTILNMVPSQYFTSAWMSAGTSEEWVYVDLGSSSTFDKIKLFWINKATKGAVQVSEDAMKWATIASLPSSESLNDSITLNKQAKGRYVRILMNQPANGKNYLLSELEVYGKGGLTARPKNNPKADENKMYLAAGNWKIQRASQVTGNGESISTTGYDSNGWIVATVPGTALVSYLNAGALPDPNFGDNQLMISESFFNSDFWYRDEFDVPSTLKGERIFLNFDGINWKADIFVNGRKTGRIDGAFIRGNFDVTGRIVPGQKNAIAVLIHKNDHIGIVDEQTMQSPGKNGGILGADNPTFHASIGWDWIPTIRGRNTGIWNDVYLTATGPVTIEDPLVYTDLPLPDTTSADLHMELTLKNHKAEAVEGILTGSYDKITFEQKVSLAPYETKQIMLDPTTHPALHMNNPKLWWPKGYGEQNLYDVNLTFKTGNIVSDSKDFKSGVREMTFREDSSILNMYVNGRRFIGRGGNWGFAESNLNYRGREYDAAVAYHADMNFNMIRNWVGQIGDDEFYEACDRYGVMVWQDFWLANPADGPDPDDPAMFMKNAYDFTKRIRNHPSIGIYVGRNEGNPPMVIDTALKAMVQKLHPGLYYIPNSASGIVSGGGPYRALPIRDYFLLYGYNRFHSERGMPNVMTYESLVKTLPENALWPQNRLWGIHDYNLEGAQSAASFNQMVEKAFGKARDAREFTEWAQWINYNGYRGMFEGRSDYRQGLLLWMSHPAWPSMVWQTYDYYLEPTAAYFGCKKASEAIHIQWSPIYNEIEIVNYNAKNRTGLTAKAEILNMDGTVQWKKESRHDCKEDSTVKCFRLEFPKSLSPVHFIRLTLSENGKVISENFYWRGIEDGNYQALRTLPQVELSSRTSLERRGDIWVVAANIKNNTKTPALMIRLKVVGNSNHERILPVLYSDNYISLMPGEEKNIIMKLKNADTRGEKPMVEVSGFNVRKKYLVPST